MINVMKEAHEYARARTGRNRKTYKQNLIAGLKKFHAIVRKERIIESLPSLEGSDKQIAWALDIRMGMINALDNILEGIGAESKKEQRALKAAVSEVIGTLSAAWWIENRSGYDLENALIACARAKL